LPGSFLDAINPRIWLKTQRKSTDVDNLIQSIRDGIETKMVKGPLERISARLDELGDLIVAYQGGEPPKPLVHPSMAKRYRSEVKNLRKALGSQDACAEASEHLRGLIGKIVLTPEPGRDELRIDLHGDLAGILQIASQKQVRPGNKTISGPNKIALVAGA
jgi:hypothetical protein